MYNHILVATAFHDDDTERQALAAAAKLASEGARVSVLHVREAIPSSAVNLLPADYMAGLRAEMRAKLDQIAGQFERGEGHLVEGHAGRTIVDWADRNDVDCIVIASHRPGLQDYLLGSTAGRVVRHANCSVHVLR